MKRTEIQDFINGWRWMNEHNGVWGKLYWTRFEAMEDYVYWWMHEAAAKLSYLPTIAITKPGDIPARVVRLLWRRHRRIGKISLVKSTLVHYDGWLDLEKNL